MFRKSYLYREVIAPVPLAPNGGDTPRRNGAKSKVFWATIGPPAPEDGTVVEITMG